MLTVISQVNGVSELKWSYVAARKKTEYWNIRYIFLGVISRFFHVFNACVDHVDNSNLSIIKY